MYTNNSSLVFDPNVAPAEVDLSSESLNLLNFDSDGTYFSNANNRLFTHLGYSGTPGVNYLLVMFLFNAKPADKSKLVYKVTRKQVTENFVDVNGAKITAPTGFTQGNQVPMNSNTFKYTAAKLYQRRILQVAKSIRSKGGIKENQAKYVEQNNNSNVQCDL